MLQHTPQSLAAPDDSGPPRGDHYWWRLFGTGLSFTVFGIGGFLLWLVVFPLLRVWPESAARRRQRARRVIQALFYVFIEMMRRLGVLSYRFEGAERLGRAGQLIVANHPSLLDVVFLVAHLRDTNCLVKHSLWRNPFMRGPIRAAQYISNADSASMVESAAAVLAEGQTLIAFPEGTRSVPGQALAFHRGAASMAVRAASVLTPVLIRCEPPTLGKHSAWYRIPPRRMHYSFIVGADIDLSAWRGERSPPVAARQLNEHLQQYFTEELARNERIGT